MNPAAELEDFPVGCRVRTPSGRIGRVAKHKTTSKYDCFSRVHVVFDGSEDTVDLQPGHLERVPEEEPQPYKNPLEGAPRRRIYTQMELPL